MFTRLQRTLTYLLLLALAAPLAAQPLGDDVLNRFSNLGGLGLEESSAQAQFSAYFVPAEEGRPALLAVQANMLEGWYIYSLSQQEFPATKLALGDTDQVKLLGEFKADQKPKIVEEDFLDVPLEKHFEQVTFFAPIEIADGVDPQTLAIPLAKPKGQVCSDVCVPFEQLPPSALDITARMATDEQREYLLAVAGGDLPSDEPALIDNKLLENFSSFNNPGGLTDGPQVQFDAYILPKTDTRSAMLAIEARMQPSWYIYSLTQQQPLIATKFVATPSEQFQITGEFLASVKPKSEETPYYDVPLEKHGEPVVFFAPIDIAEGVDPSSLKITGKIKGQACQSGETGLCMFFQNVPGASEFIAVPASSDKTKQLAAAIGTSSTSNNFVSSHWQPFDRKKFDALLAQQQPVAVSFTAAWDPTCLVNHKTVYETQASETLLQSREVHAFVADWTLTTNAPEVSALLESLGAKTVPLLAVYPAGGGEPKILPGLIKQSTFFDAIRAAAPVPALEPGVLGEIQLERSHALVRGYIEPQVVQPGGKAVLKLSVIPHADYHVYPYSRVAEEFGAQPTLIVLKDTGGMPIGEPQADSPTEEKFETLHHVGATTWTMPINVPEDAPHGVYTIDGLFGYQVCASTCDTPAGTEFRAQLTVTDKTVAGQAPVDFAPSKYAKAVDALKDRVAFAGEKPLPKEDADDASGSPKAAGAGPGDYTFFGILALAFVGGLILNVMPCVLPVIGLKIFSFIEQSNQSRAKAFLLNFWYAAGVIAIFMVLGGLAAVFQLGWGELLLYAEFNIAMAVVIFVMGLSFIGVWEIPIPGFVGSTGVAKASEKEGYEGAFIKGGITTLLATPCTGPFMGTALVGVLGRPAPEILTIFFTMGLGMASPYLLIGAFPQLVKFLPKPGEWMNTFKHVMGFMLIGTVVYLLAVMEPQYYVVPTVALLFGAWMACSMIGSLPLTASTQTRWMVRGGALGVCLAVGLLSFLFLAPIMAGLDENRIFTKIDKAVDARLAEGGEYKVEQRVWQPFTQRKLDWLLERGKPVIVEFTSTNCLNCRVNERVVLKTDETKSLLKENDVYTLVAHWTVEDETDEVSLLMKEFNVKAVPLVAVYPAGSDKPELIPGLLQVGSFHDKIRAAAASKPEDTRMVLRP